MIISYSNDFVLVRIPKTASTTCVAGLYDMGAVVESEGDLCPGVEASMEYESEDSTRSGVNWGSWITGVTEILDPNMYCREDPRHRQLYRQHVWHTGFHRLVEVGLVDEDMPCVSTIRHPVDRFLSINAFLGKHTRVPERDPNSTWDQYKNGDEVFGMWENMFRLHQDYYVPEHATLWNIENLYDWMKRFAKEKGLVYKEPIYFKNNKKYRTVSLTSDREQEILDHFEKDFLLWEQAFREFN
jgi:hypothetical protein